MNHSSYSPRTGRELSPLTLTAQLHCFPKPQASQELSLYCYMRVCSEKLYCALTCTLINKKADSVKRHLKGKAFMKAKGTAT